MSINSVSIVRKTYQGWKAIFQCNLELKKRDAKICLSTMSSLTSYAKVHFIEKGGKYF